MIKLAIIHFQPLEKYPPIVNILDYFSENQLYSSVFSTKHPKNFDTYKNKQHKIRRFQSINSNFSLRIIQYLNFYIGTLIQLIRTRPTHILWFETLSAFPAIIYYYLRFKKLKLFVHYHEYESPEEICHGMFLTRLFRRMEKKVYPKLTWLSHTNQERMGLFVSNYPSVNPESMRIMPNYPPRWWGNFPSKKHEAGKTTKLVYVGVLSTETTYIKEILQFVTENKEQFSCDFYSFSLDKTTEALFNQYQSPLVQFKGALAQKDFPVIISKYDVGLILYKGHIPNYIFNAPNKLFEYLACGIDVWYPHVLQSSKPYKTMGVYPKVIPVDFENLAHFDWKAAIDKTDLIHRPSTYFCEEVYGELIKEINAANG